MGHVVDHEPPPVIEGSRIVRRVLEVPFRIGIGNLLVTIGVLAVLVLERVA